MLKCGDEATPLAVAARLPLLADEALGQPQRQALLANSAWTLEQEGLWQPRSGNGASQPPFDPVMSKQGA
jgi:hypothetical protein